MPNEGTIEAIHVAPEAEAPMESRDTVEAIAGQGIKGDRYFKDIGTFSDVPRGGLEITLTEAEAIEAVERETELSIDFDEHRRNVTTRGVALNHLVGEHFRVGDAICEGIRLCEPCDHLQRLTFDGINDALTHRGGLRAEIIEDGELSVGDTIEQIERR